MIFAVGNGAEVLRGPIRRGFDFHQVTVKGAALSQVGQTLAGQLIDSKAVRHETGPVKTLDDGHAGGRVLGQAGREVTLSPVVENSHPHLFLHTSHGSILRMDHDDRFTGLCAKIFDFAKS